MRDEKVKIDTPNPLELHKPIGSPVQRQDSSSSSSSSDEESKKHKTASQASIQTLQHANNPFKKDKKDSSPPAPAAVMRMRRSRLTPPNLPVELHKPIVSSPVQRQDSSSSSSSSDEDSKNKGPSKPGFQEQGSKQARFKLPTIENPFKKDKKDSSSSSSSSSDEDEKVKIETPKPPVVELHKPIVSSPVQRQDSSSSSSSSDEDSKNKGPSKPGFNCQPLKIHSKRTRKTQAPPAPAAVMRMRRSRLTPPTSRCGTPQTHCVQSSAKTRQLVILIQL
ncbi:uncharacterized protein LOC131880737 [Tigriopus californicus]|uniref:uncharacterized protein LOC131880737 n=1 Tax=Tigriopus californicus TaxID=6832 RepID=UPI0027DA8B04|nr:uncharacterized protein LOC131880737 [Tigriopus californicus]